MKNNPIINKKMWTLFKDIRNNISKDLNFNGNFERIEELYYLLSRTLLHDKSMLEFKRRFENKIGECVFLTDYDNPMCDNSKDGLILSEKSTRVFKLKIKGEYININWKRKEPLARDGTVGLDRYYYDKYKKDNVKIIFSIPNPAHPEYYHGGTQLTVKNHSYYLLNLNKDSEPDTSFIDHYGCRYYSLKEMIDFRLISKDQTQIKDFELMGYVK